MLPTLLSACVDTQDRGHGWANFIMLRALLLQDDGAEVLPSSADHTAGGGTLERRALAIVRETHSQYKLTLKEALADEVHFLDGLPASVDASAVEREAAATHAKHTALWSGFGTPGLPWPEPIKAGARFPSPIGWEIDNKKLQFTLEQARHTEIVRVYRYRRKLFSAAVAFAAAVVFPVISLYTFKPMINDRSYRAAISEASFGNTALAAIAIFLGMINALPYCIFVCVFFDGTALPPRLRTCCFGLRHCGGCCDASMRCGCFPRFITAAKQTSSKT
jgi:hypothetical protein